MRLFAYPNPRVGFHLRRLALLPYPIYKPSKHRLLFFACGQIPRKLFAIFLRQIISSRLIYAGYSEASQVPPGWHGWMHHRVDTPPSQEKYEAREWQLPHQENLTGSTGAYHPPGSIAVGGKPRQVVADYQAWKPE